MSLQTAHVNVPHLHVHSPHVEWQSLEHPIRAALASAGIVLMAIAGVQVVNSGAPAEAVSDGVAAVAEFVQPTSILPAATKYGQPSGFENMYGRDAVAPSQTEGYERMYAPNVRETNVDHMFRSQH